MTDEEFLELAKKSTTPFYRDYRSEYPAERASAAPVAPVATSASRPQMSTTEDVLRSGASGVGRGVVSLPGVLGDIAQLRDIAPPLANYYLHNRNLPEVDRTRLYNEEVQKTQAAQTPDERSGRWGRMLGVHFPTSQRMIDAATGVIPGVDYEPSTQAGRVVQTAGEVLGGALPSGGFGSGRAIAQGGAGAASRAARAALTESRPLTNAAIGATSGAAGELARDSDKPGAEALARLAGAGVGAGALGAGRALAHRTGFVSAEQQLAEAAKSSRGPGINAEQYLEARQQGLQPSLGEVRGVGERARQAWGRVENQPEGQTFRNWLEDRNLDRNQMVADAVRNSTKGDVDAFSVTQAAEAARKAALGPQYDTVFNLPHAQNFIDKDLSNVLTTTPGRRAAIEAVDSVAAELNQPVVKPFTVNPDGSLTLTPGANLDLRFWDHVKKRLQRDAYSVQPGQSPDPTISNLAKTVRQGIGKNVPEYNNLMDEAQRYVRGGNAYEAGQEFGKILKSREGANSQDFGRFMHNFKNVMTAEERELVARGLMSRFYAKPEEAARVLGGGAGASSPNTTIARARAKAILEALPEKDAYDKIVTAATLHRSMGQTIREPSRNTGWLHQIGAATTPLGAGAAAYHFIPGGAMAAIPAAAAAMLFRYMHGKYADAQSRQILNIVMGNAPGAEERLASLLKNNPSAAEKYARMATDYGAMVTASTPDEPERPGHARGGKIRAPNAGKHKAKAMSLIRAAEQAKKAHNSTTEPTLDMPDEMVAKALSIADKAI
jgi:hypothetical protein